MYIKRHMHVFSESRQIAYLNFIEESKYVYKKPSEDTNIIGTPTSHSARHVALALALSRIVVNL